jgi:hypothetical protein
VTGGKRHERRIRGTGFAMGKQSLKEERTPKRGAVSGRAKRRLREKLRFAEKSLEAEVAHLWQPVRR